MRVVRQVHDGFGLARARNLGAAAAGGQVLIFLDADMIPERRFVESHARWHHACHSALVMGFRRHTLLDDLSPVETGDLVRSGRFAAVAMQHDLGAPAWLEAHFARTGEATESVADLFRLVTGGNFSVRADDYSVLGASSEVFREYGGEDREFGFRAQVDGLVFIPERNAFAWHQGPGGWQAADIAARKAAADARLASYIADRSMRPPGVVVPERPTLAIVGGDPERLTKRLAVSEFRDFTVHGAEADAWSFSPVRLELYGDVGFGPGSLARIVDRIRTPQRGRLDIESEGVVVAVARLQRAVRRAQRCGVDRDAFDVVGFGAETIQASDVGITQAKRRRWWPGGQRS